VGVLHRPVSSFVYAGKGSDARAVLVDGQVVYRDGRFPRFADGDRVMAEAEQVGRTLIERAGLGRRLSIPWPR
jgi:5-methylthioadenosine/S-adenosylhomocysteine deaminase